MAIPSAGTASIAGAAEMPPRQYYGVVWILYLLLDISGTNTFGMARYYNTCLTVSPSAISVFPEMASPSQRNSLTCEIMKRRRSGVGMAAGAGVRLDGGGHQRERINGGVSIERHQWRGVSIGMANGNGGSGASNVNRNKQRKMASITAAIGRMTAIGGGQAWASASHCCFMTCPPRFAGQDENGQLRTLLQSLTHAALFSISAAATALPVNVAAERARRADFAAPAGGVESGRPVKLHSGVKLHAFAKASKAWRPALSACTSLLTSFCGFL